uniref:Uncharacterized protein n=1 Tax=Rhizophora mucronata TaxID=61149 RepID=A0A2P2NH47_RHIMU
MTEYMPVDHIYSLKQDLTNDIVFVSSKPKHVSINAHQTNRSRLIAWMQV